MSPTLNFVGIATALRPVADSLLIEIMLTLRPTGLSPPIYRDQLDYEVLEDGRPIGRMYEDLHALPGAAVGWRPGRRPRQAGAPAYLGRANSCELPEQDHGILSGVLRCDRHHKRTVFRSAAKKSHSGRNYVLDQFDSCLGKQGSGCPGG